MPKAGWGGWLEELECSKVLSLLGNESESCSVLSDYWSGWPFLSPGDIPDPGIEPRSSALQVDSLPAELSGKPIMRQIK